MTFFKGIAVLLTQIHNRLHVHFVKGREHGGRVFRFQQTLCDTFTQTGHRHAFFRAARQLRCSRCCSRCGRFTFFFTRRCFRQMFFNIFASQTATHTGAFNGAGFKVMLGQQATDRRAKRIIVLLFERRLLALSRGRLFGVRFRAALFACAVTFAQAAQNLAGRYGSAFIFQHCVQNAVCRCRYFQYHFVSFDFYQHFIALDGIARFFVPGRNGRVSNGLRQVGYKNIYATHYLSFN